MNLLNILTGLAVWTAVSIVARSGIGHVLSCFVHGDSPTIANNEFQEEDTFDSTLEEAA